MLAVNQEKRERGKYRPTEQAACAFVNECMQEQESTAQPIWRNLIDRYCCNIECIGRSDRVESIKR